MNRIQYTTTSTGTGNLTLSVSPGYQDINSADFWQYLGSSGECWYMILAANGTDWEFGQGSIFSLDLTRANVGESTNGGSAINLAAGTHTVFVSRSGLEGVQIMNVLTAITPAAIPNGGSNSQTLDNLQQNGNVAIPGGTAFAPPYAGSISFIKNLMTMVRSWKATYEVQFTGNAGGGGVYCELTDNFSNYMYGGFAPNINGVLVSATAHTPWLDVIRADNNPSGAVQVPSLFWLERNTGSAAITPVVARMYIEFRV